MNSGALGAGVLLCDEQGQQHVEQHQVRGQPLELGRLMERGLLLSFDFWSSFMILSTHAVLRAGAAR